MPKRLDLTNQRFGKLVALTPTHKNKRTAWKCQCDCGNILEVFTTSLTSGNTSSCGCGQNRPNEVGKQYGKLTVCEKANSKNNKSYWVCRCECGKMITCSGDSLRRGHTTSCGCSKIIDETNNHYGTLTVINLAYVKDNVAFWNCQCTCGNTPIVAGTHLRSGHTRSCGCIKSFGEQQINSILSTSNLQYKTQYAIKINDTWHRFDYAIFNNQNNIVCFIEFDGEQHFNKRSSWYNNTHAKDIIKTQYCEKHNIPLIRIPYWELNKVDLDYILNLIKPYHK